MQTGFFEAMTQPVAGLTLLVFMAASCPLAVIAQLPTRQQGQIPARLNNSADIRRVNPDGTVTREELPINFAQNVNEQTNPILRENDIIVVCRSSSTRITDTLGLLLNPAGSILAALSIPDRIAGILTLLGIIDRDDDD